MPMWRDTSIFPLSRAVKKSCFNFSWAQGIFFFTSLHSRRKSPRGLRTFQGRQGKNFSWLLRHQENCSRLVYVHTFVHLHGSLTFDGDWSKCCNRTGSGYKQMPFRLGMIGRARVRATSIFISCWTPGFFPPGCDSSTSRAHRQQ